MDEPLGTKDAAQYVSEALQKRGKKLSAATVKNRIDHGEIPVRIIGRSRVFAKADLDAFVENYAKSDIKPGPRPGSHHKRKES